jgi:hypothetical protein
MYLNHWKKLIFIGVVTARLIIVPEIKSQTFYLNIRVGNDGNPGTKEKPIQTFERIAEIFN